MLFQLFGPVLFSSHVYGSFAAADAQLAVKTPLQQCMGASAMFTYLIHRLWDLETQVMWILHNLKLLTSTRFILSNLFFQRRMKNWVIESLLKSGDFKKIHHFDRGFGSIVKELQLQFMVVIRKGRNHLSNCKSWGI